eukprot:90390_1
MRFIIHVLIGFITCLAQLNPNVPPGKNFDLSHFKLVLPDQNVTTITEKQLMNGYESQYFYTDKSDGSMTFYCPANGGHTQDASNPRSELHHNCNPANNHYNWSILKGNYSINGTYKIDKNHTSSKTTIQQIHGFGVPPLVKIHWESQSGTANVLANYKLTDQNTPSKTVLLGEVGYDKFTFETRVKNQHMILLLNGDEKLNVDVSYWKYGNYFKAGDYLGTNKSDEYDIVHMYSLNVVIDGPCTDYS